MARLEFAHSDDRWHLPISHCRAVGGTANDTGRSVAGRRLCRAASVERAEHAPRGLSRVFVFSRSVSTMLSGVFEQLRDAE
jgi:hypothetical protein